MPAPIVVEARSMLVPVKVLLVVVENTRPLRKKLDAEVVEKPRPKVLQKLAEVVEKLERQTLLTEKHPAVTLIPLAAVVDPVLEILNSVVVELEVDEAMAKSV